MFPSALTFKAALIGAAGAAAIGFASGVWVRDAFCDAASAKLQLDAAHARIEEMERDQEIALGIQTRMTIRASDLRVENERLRKAADEISEQFRADAAKPQAQRCDFSDVERERLRKEIPVGAGRPAANSRRR